MVQFIIVAPFGLEELFVMGKTVEMPVERDIISEAGRKKNFYMNIIKLFLSFFSIITVYMRIY